MEVQWMLVAQSGRFWHSTKTLDVFGIFERATVPGPPYAVRFVAFVKLRAGPLEAGSATSFTWRVTTAVQGAVLEGSLPYRYPSWAEILEGATPYVALDFTPLEVQQPGEYVIELLDGDRPLASEGFTIRAASEPVRSAPGAARPDIGLLAAPSEDNAPQASM